MPNDFLKTLGEYLNPEDIVTLAGPLAGVKPTAGITAAMYAPELNENEAAELEKLRAMRPPAPVPRETPMSPEMEQFANRLKYEQFVGELRKQYGKHSDLMLQGIIKQAERDEAQAAKMRGPRATPPIAPAARHEMFAPAGKFRKYNGGGKVKALQMGKEFLTGPMVDREVRKVRQLGELGRPALPGLIARPTNAEIAGWHIAQDVPGVMKTGALTNKNVGANNAQGFPPAHVGGAYFYSDPQLALTKREDLLEMLGNDPALAEQIPVLRAQLRMANRLAPDEDVGLNIPWQQSFEEGSFATKRPVMLNQIDRIYASNPDVMKDIIRDTVVRQRRYADGGMIEHTTPDMADGGRMLYTDSLDSYAKGGSVQRFGGGGKAGKTVQQMADELLTKGVKTPDLSRRGFLKLPDLTGPKESKLPVPLKDVQQFEKERTAVDPLTGAIEKTVEKVAETPMSRRQVLQGALAQAAQRVLPAFSPVNAAKSAVTQAVKEAVKETVAPSMPTTVQGLIARAAKMGLDYDDTVKLLGDELGVDESEVWYMLPAMRDPFDYVTDLGEESMSRARALANVLGTDLEKPMSMRNALREIRRENPEMLQQLRDFARDVAEYGFE